MNRVRGVQPNVNRSVLTHPHPIDPHPGIDSFSVAFEQLGIGIIIIGNELRILLQNDLARELLHEGTTIKETGCGLVAAVPGESTRLAEMLISAVSRTGALGGRAILRGLDKRHASITVRSTPDELRDRTGAAAFVYIALLHTTEGPDWSKPLEDLFGMTRTEARIASLLANGRSPKEIAAELEMTYESVRFVLKQAFSKANVHRQAEFVALVHTVVVDRKEATPFEPA